MTIVMEPSVGVGSQSMRDEDSDPQGHVDTNAMSVTDHAFGLEENGANNTTDVLSMTGEGVKSWSDGYVLDLESDGFLTPSRDGCVIPSSDLDAEHDTEKTIDNRHEQAFSGIAAFQTCISAFTAKIFLGAEQLVGTCVWPLIPDFTKPKIFNIAGNKLLQTLVPGTRVPDSCGLPLGSKLISYVLEISSGEREKAHSLNQKPSERLTYLFRLCFT